MAHLTIILREQKPPPGATPVTRRPSVPGPQALQACPNTLSVQPDWAGHRFNVHSVWVRPLPSLSPLHPSSSWGFSLAGKAVEGKLETQQGSCMRRPSCLPWTTVATPSFTLEEPHTVCIFQIGRERPREWTRCSGSHSGVVVWVRVFRNLPQRRTKQPQHLLATDGINWRHSILVKGNVLQIQSQQCTCLTQNIGSPLK